MLTGNADRIRKPEAAAHPGALWRECIMSKNRKLIFKSFSIACAISIITCIIVNIATEQQVTWAAYPILAVPFGWLVFSPLLVKKHGVLLSICSTTLFVLPFLLILEKITPVKDWFAPLGIPTAIVGMATIWVIYFMFRFLRISLWYKSAVAIFIVGVFASPIINDYIDSFLSNEPRLLMTIINIIAFIAISVAIFVIGYKRNKAGRESARTAD